MPASASRCAMTSFCPGVACRLVELLLDRLQVRKREFSIDRLDVVERIDRARHVGDVVIFETAHDVRDGIGLSDISQELVAEPFAFRCARDKARDIDEFHRGRQDLLRLNNICQHIQARIGNRHNADIGLDRAERVVFRRNFVRGQRVEQCRLADVRQTDDATGNSHESVSCV